MFSSLRNLLTAAALLTMIVTPVFGQTAVQMISSGDVAYTLFDNGDLQPMRINGSNGSMYYTPMLSLDAPAEEMSIDGTTLFVALADSGIAVVDLSNPYEPALAHRIADMPADYVASNGDTLYYGMGKQAGALDISTVTSPVVLGTRTGAWSIKDIDVSAGGRAIISSLSGLEILHAPASDSMTVLGSYTDEAVGNLMLDGNTGYTAYRNFDDITLNVFDLTVPSTPVVLGSHSRLQGETIYLNNRYYHDIAINGSVLYVAYEYSGQYADNEYGIEVWDVSNNASPSPDTMFVMDTEVTAVTIANGYLIAVAGNVYHVFDISNSLRPVEVNSLFAPEQETAGLPASPLLVHSYPNPFNPTTTITVELGRASDLQVAVYDILGRQVAELHSGWVEVGSHTMQFNAADLASGVYFLRASTLSGLKATSRLVLVR